MEPQSLTLPYLVECLARPDGGDAALLPYAQEVRARFSSELLLHTPTLDRRVAIRRAVEALHVIVPRLFADRGLVEAEADHGPGHWCRDYVNALRLGHDVGLSPRLVVPCILGGTLHDVGTLFVDRYADRHRLVRHAEVGALAFKAAAHGSGLTTEEIDLVAYAIAAHTHYLKPTEVTLGDGTVHTVTPYADMDGDRPLLEVWLARWVDRLDCSGATFVGRHALVSVRDFHDFSSHHGFYPVRFADHMRPLLRTREQVAASDDKAQTMLEHLMMFANSQTNASPYGRHDLGAMVQLRDAQRAALERICHRVLQPLKVDEGRVPEAWVRFLATNIEPSPAGREAAARLKADFVALAPETRRAWTSGFYATMGEYRHWAASALAFIEALPASERSLVGLPFDLPTLIRPDPSWVDLLP